MHDDKLESHVLGTIFIMFDKRCKTCWTQNKQVSE